jgi:hypothetical protein
MVVVGNPVPIESTLHSISGKIIRASTTHPNVEFMKENGSLVTLEFPSVGYALIQGFSNPVIKNSSIDALNSGCGGTVLIDRVKFIPFKDVYRIWSVQCGLVSLSYSDISSVYARALVYSYWINGVGQIVVLIFLGLVIYIDWRKKWLAFR